MVSNASQSLRFVAVITKTFLMSLVALSSLGSISILGVAASPGDVVINEIAWMGTAASSSDEWIELYNNTHRGIDVTGWILVATKGTLRITLSGTISPHGYFLLERTDDMTVSDISADWTGSFSTGLLNDGDVLTLNDELANVIDTANGDDGPWPGGSNSSSTHRYTMERINPLVSDADTNWATNSPNIARTGVDANSNPINGTPKARNSATNTEPVADAGADQTALIGETVQLNGSGSSDPDGDTLSYIWSFSSRPEGSAAALSSQTIAEPTFVVDAVGDYVLELVVEDGYGGADRDRMTVTAHAPPTANFAHSPSQLTTWDTIQYVDQSSDSDGTIVDWS